MKKVIKSAIFAATVLIPTKVMAADVVKVNVPDEVKGQGLDIIIKNVTNTLSLIAGALAVIAIVIGGILYITSAGDEKRIGMAKNTILYAVVGMVIAVLAFSIANFVLKGVSTGTP